LIKVIPPEFLAGKLLPSDHHIRSYPGTQNGRIQYATFLGKGLLENQPIPERISPRSVTNVRAVCPQFLDTKTGDVKR
jgi:hypothetical protein